MYRMIVVGWDGSDRGRDALALARQLRAADGSVIAACVYPDPGPGRARANERGIIDSAREAAQQARLEADEEWLEARAVPGHSAAHGLHQLVQGEGADLVVVGSSHRGEVGQVLAGSVGQRLLNGSPCPVAVAPMGFRDRAAEPRVVGVAYDGSQEAASALHEGAALAEELDGTVKIVAVVPPFPEMWVGNTSYAPLPADEELETSRRDAYAKRLEEATESLPEGLPADTALLEGRPADMLADEARQGIDIMVMGSRNYGPLRHVMLGSTAIELLRMATCPVIVIPRGASTPSAQSASSAAATA